MAQVVSEPRRVAGAESGRRLLSVLLAYTPEHPHWSVPELAAALDLTQSAAYRYVALLREVGLLEHVDGTSTYRVSERITQLSEASRASRPPLEDVAEPVLRRLRDTIDETILLGRRSGSHVYTLARAESRKPVRLQFEPGQAMRLHVGSIPRVLLASMNPRDREQYLETLPPEERESELVSEETLARIAQEGVVESFAEIDEGIWGVAALVRHGRDRSVALGCAAPMYRTDADKRRMIRELVVAGAAEITALLEDV